MRTAVGAPADEPFGDLFAVLDRMTVTELVAFTQRVLALARPA